MLEGSVGWREIVLVRDDSGVEFELLLGAESFGGGD